MRPWCLVVLFGALLPAVGLERLGAGEMAATTGRGCEPVELTPVNNHRCPTLESCWPQEWNWCQETSIGQYWDLERNFATIPWHVLFGEGCELVEGGEDCEYTLELDVFLKHTGTSPFGVGCELDIGSWCLSGAVKCGTASSNTDSDCLNFVRFVDLLTCGCEPFGPQGPPGFAALQPSE